MDLLQPGQKLSLNIQKEENVVEIICSIAEIYEDRMVIDLPQYFMRYIEYLEVGCPLTVKVFSKLGTIDFNTVVISSPLEDEFSVEFDEGAVRLTEGSELPVINAIESMKIKRDEDVFYVKTFEISTEYLKFYSDKTFQEGDSFDCELMLPQDYGTIYFVATISEVDDVYENEYTVTYSALNEYDRQTLLYYMYVYSYESDDQVEIDNEKNS